MYPTKLRVYVVFVPCLIFETPIHNYIDYLYNMHTAVVLVHNIILCTIKNDRNSYYVSFSN